MPAKKRDSSGAFNRGFNRLARLRYGGSLASGSRPRSLDCGGLRRPSSRARLALFPLLGRDFFPSVDAGLIRFTCAARPGRAIEETENVFARIEDLDPRGDPGGGARDDDRQHRLAHQRLNLSLGDRSADLVRGRRDARPAQAQTPGHARVRQGASPELSARDAGDRRLLPRAGHHDPGAELWPDRAHRRADRRPTGKQRQQLRDRPTAARRDGARSWRRGRPPCASGQPARAHA